MDGCKRVHLGEEMEEKVIPVGRVTTRCPPKVINNDFKHFKNRMTG
jgi:hypothetical protein